MPKKGKKSQSKVVTVYKQDTSLKADLAAAGRLGARALVAFKGAKGFFNTETKYVDQQLSGSASTTPVLLLLSGIAQGDTGSTRDGNSVKVTSHTVKVGILQHTSAVTTRVRVIIFADTQNQSADPTAADVVSMSTSALTFPDLASKPGRFVVLKDVVEYMVIGTGKQAMHMEFHLNEMKNCHLQFVGTGATVASVSGLAIYAYIYAAEATNTPTYYVASRLTYVDN